MDEQRKLDVDVDGDGDGGVAHGTGGDQQGGGAVRVLEQEQRARHSTGQL